MQWFGLILMVGAVIAKHEEYDGWVIQIFYCKIVTCESFHQDVLPQINEGRTVSTNLHSYEKKHDSVKKKKLIHNIQSTNYKRPTIVC